MTARVKYTLLYLTAIVLTALLFCHQIDISDVFDVDGISYLKAAGGYLDSGVKGALSAEGPASWPFYSVVIAMVAKTTQLSFLHAAHLIDLIFEIGVVLFFISLIRYLGADFFIQCLALVVILVWHSYTKYWPNIFREHGFWFFLLASVFFLLEYSKSFSWRMAFFWLLSMGCAFLFRLEAIMYFVLCPLAILFLSNYSLKQRFKYYLKLYALPILAIVIASAVVFYYVENLPEARFDQIQKYFFHYGHNTWHHFHGISQNFRDKVLQYPDDTAIYGLIGGLLVVFFAEIFKIIGVLNLIALGYLLIERFNGFALKRHPVFNAYLMTAFLIGLLFFAQHFYVSRRYIIPVGLFLAFWVPFAIEKAIRLWRTQSPRTFKTKLVVGLFIIALIYEATATLIHFGHSKHYLKRAGLYLKDNTKPSETVYTNSSRVMYYASDAPSYSRGAIMSKSDRYDFEQDPRSFLKNKAWRCYDFLALNVEAETSTVIKGLSQHPNWVTEIYSTSGHKNDKVIIYRIQQASDCYDSSH
ncbi:MAG: hypothetical protein ACE365_02345 [Gammaproteobacteria bacterium]